jgi:hypothetical protein
MAVSDRTRPALLRIRPAALATVLSIGGLLTLGAAVDARAESAQANSADRLIFWTRCNVLPELSDAELDMWKDRGVDGFACVVGHLRGMGGVQDFTGEPGAQLGSSNYTLQRTLRDSNIVGRAAARDMKLYLGAYLVNYYNASTPMVDWFDQTGWSNTVLPRMRELAEAARLLGFAGIAFDQELYPQLGGATTASWSWNYPDNSRPEDQVRAKAKQRGQELMRTIVDAFPGVELLAYHVYFPETWNALVQREVNGLEDAYRASLDADFWDGLSSIEGYRAIRLIDGTFYKTPHIGTWESAFQYHYNRLYSYLSRTFSNWEYASSRLFVSPFSWIDAGPCSCPFDDARSPQYVAEQLEAFRKWGMGGEFANYAYAGLRGFDYSPYERAMRSASGPALADPEPPALTIAGATPGGARGTPGESLALDGTATDNLAIRSVRWRSDGGGAGVARLGWHVRSGGYRSRYAWEMRWSIPAVRLMPGENEITVTAEDIKGQTTTRTLRVSGGSPLAPGPTESRGSSGGPRSRARSKALLLRKKRRCLRRARLLSTRAKRRVAKRRCVARYRAGLKRVHASRSSLWPGRRVPSLRPPESRPPPTRPARTAPPSDR